MPFAPSICLERVSYILVSTDYLSNVACNGQEVKLLCVSVVFATVWNLTPFRLFLPRDCLLFSLLLACCMSFYVGKVICCEMTGFEMIPDMLVVNVFPAIFVTLGPAIFSYSFRRCRISIVYFSPA